MARLAFGTFGILRSAWDQPQVQGFVDRIAMTFDAATKADGFIWYRREIGADYVVPRFVGPAQQDLEAVTLSLWADLEAVRTYAYRGTHGEGLRQRSEWFVKAAWPTYVAWWVDDDHEPTWAEMKERLEHLHDHGPTPLAFNFKTPFDAAGQPVRPQNSAAWGAAL